jgi:hypothetical protein
MKMPMRTTKKQVRAIYGYQLRIKRTATSKTERVGYLFDTSRDAMLYRDLNFSDVERWSIEAVRLNIQPRVSDGNKSNH